MIFDRFDGRTLANMEVALDRICKGRPEGEDHELRSFIADSLVQARKKEGQLWERSQKRVRQHWHAGRKT